VAENSVGQPDKSGHLQTARQDHPESVATTQPAPHQSSQAGDLVRRLRTMNIGLSHEAADLIEQLTK